MKQRVLTQYSSHAHTIADTFRAAFVKAKLGDYLIEMTAPEESTQGGKLALQHITLKPEAGGMTLVVGTVNAAEKRAELRTFEHISKVHTERFKKSLPFDEAQYKDFVEKAEPLLAAFGLEVKTTDAPRDVAPSFADPKESKDKAASKAPPPPGEEPLGEEVKRPKIAMVGLAVGAVLIVLAIYLALR